MDVKSLFSLEGKKGFITGSTRGIGKTLAQAFIELGADVAILGTNAENAKKVASELSNGKSKVIGYECRVTDPDSVNAMMPSIMPVFLQVMRLSIFPRRTLSRSST